MSEIDALKGKFITVEGIEGGGKTTVVPHIRSILEGCGLDVLVTREPGGTEAAEAIRQVLLTNWEESLTPQTELLLMFAARAQHVSQVIVPHIDAGGWVVCERFTDASFAYQGGGREIPLPYIDSLADLVHREMWPDLTIYLDLNVADSFSRTRERHKDRIEREDEEFFENVLKLYRSIAKTEDRVVTIDANQPLARVTEEVEQHVRQLMNGRT